MIQSNILRKKADAAAGSSVTERLSQHASAAARRTHEAHGEMDRRALTRTVGPQEPENFSGLDLQTETIQSTQPRSEEHTSELQSRLHLVCRLLLEKKKHHTTVRAQLP